MREEASCVSFPYLFDLTTNKEVLVADFWNFSWEVGGWIPFFLRPFHDWELKKVVRFLLLAPRDENSS